MKLLSRLLSAPVFCSFLFSPLSLAESSQPVQWTSETHQDYYLDVNGDGVQDLLLKPVIKGQKASVTFGKKRNYQTFFDTNMSLSLPAKYEDVKWHKKKVSVVTGFFTNDLFEDALLIHPKKQKAILLTGGIQGLTQHSIVFPDVMPFLENGKHYDFHVGDFNGDGMDDLVATDTKEGMHQLYHSFPYLGLNLVQEIDNANQWGLKKSEKLYIDDLNGDGKDDIFALAKKSKKKHYIIYSDEKGLFTDENVEVLKAQFADVDWNDERYSTTVTFGEEGPELTRLYNQNGGVSTEGEREYDSLDPLRFEKCKLVYFKLKSKKYGKKCSFKNNVKNKKKLKNRSRQVSLFSATERSKESTLARDLQSNATSSSTLESANEQLNRLVPVEINQAPVSSVGAYPAVNQNFTLSWNASANATKYEVWVSRDRGITFENTYKSTSQTSYAMNETTVGSRFYYVKACNENGCSGFSPYSSVAIFNVPDIVSAFSPTVSQKLVGETVTLQWQRPNGVIGTGGYYEIQQTEPNGDVSWLPVISGGFSTSVSTVLSQMGQYKFKIRACNKLSSYCSELSPFEALAATIPAPPSGDAFIRNLTYTPTSMSVGNTQHYSFDYTNSTLCQSSNLKKNGAAQPGSVTYVTSSIPTSGVYDWSAQRNEAVTWEFDVSCSNATSSYSQHVVTMIKAATQPTLSPDSVSVPGGEVAVIRVLENDVDDDGQTLTIAAFTQPSLGSVTCDGQKCHYTAPPNITSNIATTFSYSVTDGMTGSVSTSVTVNLTANQQDPHVIVGGWDSTVTNTREAAGYAPIQVNVGETQSFGFSYVNVRYCENNIGNVYVADNGTLQSGTYSWSAIRENLATWDFTVTCYNNNSHFSFSALASIVGGPAPVTEDDYVVVKQNAGAVLQVLENDPDNVNKSLVVSSVSNAVHGTLSISPDGRTVTYKPNEGYVGLDSFTYDAVSGGLGTPSKTNVFVEVEKLHVDPRVLVEYDFNDATNLTIDSSSYGRHGRNEHVSYFEVDGRKVADFSVPDSYIVIPDKVTQSHSNITVSVRFKPKVLSHFETQVVFSRGYTHWSTAVSLQIQTNDYIGATLFNGGWRNLWSPSPLRADTWYEATYSWGDGVQKFYIDGVLLGSQTYNTPPKSSSALDILGNFIPRAGWGFQGYIDHFKMYSSQLSEAEIFDIANEQEAPLSDSVSISGIPALGLTLSSVKELSNVNPTSITYRWNRNGTPIYGASSSSYLVTERDLEKNITVTVSYVTNTSQYRTITSSPKTISSLPSVNIISATFIDDPLSIGLDAGLNLVFENATKCYDFDDQSVVFHESVAPLSGSLDTVMDARYIAGTGVLKIVCENASSHAQIDVPYNITKLIAPGQISAN